MTTAHKRKIACILFVLISVSSFAQGGGGPSQPGGPTGPPGLPIDGGVFLCAFVALCYGVKKLLKNN